MSTPALTPRLAQVLQCLALELSVAEIAAELSLSKHTVTTYKKHLYPLLGVHSAFEAVASSQRLGLLPTVERGT